MGGPAGTAIVEHLRTGPHRVLAADTEPDTAGHRLAGAQALLPRGTHPSYGAEVLRLVEAHRIEVIVPTVAEEVAALHDHVEPLLDLGCHVLIPEPRAVTACSDKYAFARVCAENGIPAPETVLAGEPAPQGPWIVKPRHGRGSRGVFPADTAAEAARLAGNAPDSIVQTRLAGREFTVDLLCGPDGEVVVQVPRWREQVRGGISSAGTAFRMPELEAQVELLVKALEFRGAANAQGCLAEDGSFAFFEMNPRFSGGLPISLLAGADIVEAYIALALGQPVPKESLAWEPGRRVVRYLTQAAPGPTSTPGSGEPPRNADLLARAAGEEDHRPVGRRRILVPLGTRPEIIKLAPVLMGLSAIHDIRVVFTGQHTTAALGDDMLTEFGIDPIERWTPDPRTAGSGAESLGALTSKAAGSLRRHRPDAVLVLGDTYTVPAFCLAGVAAQVPVVHLEAGLRSYNPLSREEANRRVAASLAALHLAPTERAAAVLRGEGIPAERIQVVGNPVLDALRSRGVLAAPVSERRGVLITVHRPTTVDVPERLAEVVRTVERLSREAGPVVFPVHPRTADRLRAFGLEEQLAATGAEILAPLPYTDLLRRLRHSQVVVTDSGGLQEEAAWLRVPAVVMRGSTPRWEGVEAGLARLSPVEHGAVCEAVAEVTAPRFVARLASLECPYGDGRTAEHTARVLGRSDVWERMSLREPDFTDGQVPTI
ncbi:non-hydrolyzing UDP-N-acetylglucosamine 2-epimerase [Streptomyces pathocidini]|uniref:Non-hydrolyzing UDP-N-acetylglucosamine 2-epimerase n=1 Tax=Streptomyces pathocidini TaxID=1650571 RepID=A0ABW7UR11_9ACTN|nr:UDP-N-acetylglucosamine 2-epimerase (non-hydrolyzing) [Streptomyces pathocidini]